MIGDRCDDSDLNLGRTRKIGKGEGRRRGGL